MPYWYELDRIIPYDRDAEDKCYSSKMKITASFLYGRNIVIMYKDMAKTDFEEKLLISCPGFFNPIYPEKQDGYKITVYDNESEIKEVFSSKDDLYLDADGFNAAIIPKEDFYIEPVNNRVGASSSWIFTVSLESPLERGCYIRMLLP